MLVQASQSPLTVTIVDRVYKAGRHILNIRELQARVLAKWPGSVVQVVHVEGLNLNQQIAVFQHTSILIWTHGAAMADLLFLPQVVHPVCHALLPPFHADLHVNLDPCHFWPRSNGKGLGGLAMTAEQIAGTASGLSGPAGSKRH